jgi:glutamyl-tRNA synthetase
MANDKKIRVRFAPSPTGALHIGGVRTALFNYLFAKSNGGDFILRIEDTDQKREVAGAEKYILDSLDWLGLISDESPVHPGKFGPYRQSERLDIYKKYALELVKSGHAYYAFDTDESLKRMRDTLEKSGAKNTGYNSVIRSSMKNSTFISQDEVKNLLDSGCSYVIRFKMPKDLDVTFHDEVRGNVSFNTSVLDDKILFKSDGYPTYHLANVVDDHLMEISHIIRAEEWLPSTPLHILLYEAFGWDKPVFAHLPLVLGPDGKKLSKRHAAKYGFPIFPLNWNYVNEENVTVNILGFKEANYRVDALVNFILLLGWSSGTNQEFMDIRDFYKNKKYKFDIARVSKGGAIFDFDKLKSFNASYLRGQEYEVLRKLLPDSRLGTAMSSYLYDENAFHKIIDIAKVRSVFEKDFYPSVSYFFEDLVFPENTTAKNYDEFFKFVNALLDIEHYYFNTEELLKTKVEAVCTELGFKPGKVMPDLRIALTGGKPGPELPLTMSILGRERTEKRLLCYLTTIEKQHNKISV